MKIRDKIPVDEYDYDLPEGRIASFPLPVRDRSKLLIYTKDKPLVHDTFRNLAKYIEPEKVLVINNSKVIQARIMFRKPTGAVIEILCLSPVDPPDYELAFQNTKSCVWECFAGNLKKWKSGIIKKEFTFNCNYYRLTAEKVESKGNSLNIRFSWNNASLNFADILEINGVTPLPPYIKRKAVKLDRERYQTIYSKHRGSIAAPTAGLHITEHVMNELAAGKIKLLELTLHVGAGTFQPVKEKYAGDHRMHAEPVIIKKDAIASLMGNTDKVIAVGTTTVRTLESIYWLGVKLKGHKSALPEILRLDQWEAFGLPQDIEVDKSLENIYNIMESNRIDRLFAETRMMIVPGYKFRLIRGMITNFHMPKSTLLMLVAAFVGDSWREIYEYALRNDFRFLSYGDCSLLI